LYGIAAFAAFPEGVGVFRLGCRLLLTHIVLLSVIFFDNVPIPYIGYIFSAKQPGEERPFYTWYWLTIGIRPVIVNCHASLRNHFVGQRKNERPNGLIHLSCRTHP
jgi:hypothetical protein